MIGTMKRDKQTGCQGRSKMQFLDQPVQILAMLEDYATAAGCKISTVCHYATGNKRYYERLQNRQKLNARYAKKIRKYIAENPPRQPVECP